MSLGMRIPEIRLDPYVAKTGAADPESMGILDMDRATESVSNDAGGNTCARPHELDLDPHAAYHAVCSRSA